MSNPNRAWPELVRVEWVDSSALPGWRHIDEARENIGVAHCTTVGFIIDEDEKGIHLAQNIADYPGTPGEMQVGEVMSIPVVAITKRVVLRKGTLDV